MDFWCRYDRMCSGAVDCTAARVTKAVNRVRYDEVSAPSWLTGMGECHVTYGGKAKIWGNCSSTPTYLNDRRCFVCVNWILFYLSTVHVTIAIVILIAVNCSWGSSCDTYDMCWVCCLTEPAASLTVQRSSGIRCCHVCSVKLTVTAEFLTLTFDILHNF